MSLPSPADETPPDRAEKISATHQPGVPRGRNTRHCPPPEFSPEPVAAHPLIPADDQPVEPSPDDPLAEWTQRMLQGMKRMDEDPEYRASIEKRLS